MRAVRAHLHAAAARLRTMGGKPQPRRVAIEGVSRPVIEIVVPFGVRTIRLAVRQGTTDVALPGMILHRHGVYYLPTAVEPRVIFDVGANIGAATAYFAATYPKAKVYSFEPLPENLALLRHNVAAFGDQVTVVPAGLSDQAGTFTYHMSDNPDSYGGGTFRGVGCDRSRALELPLQQTAQAMADLGVTQVDVFKIDTEGSELPILEGVPEDVRRRVQAYVGELHCQGDWRFCELLEPTHAIGIFKRPETRCYPFLAIRRDLLTR
jgi:FkbM family methyltransferase